jgi:hypothetical protein
VTEEGQAVLPQFLLTETTIRQDGSGAPVALESAAGGTIVVTLGITRIIEQESLDICIQGSADGQNWEAKPVAAFPQKFYCGTARLTLDLSKQPELKYLRAAWKLNRWGRGGSAPVFEVYVFATPAAQLSVAA